MTAKAKSKRNRLLAQIHMAVKNRRVPDANYRSWLAKNWDVDSAGKLNIEQLQEAVKYLREVGWLNGKGAGSSVNSDRPTPAQWAKLAVLCKEMGWREGLESKAMITFCRKVAKVDRPRFLDLAKAQNVIVGLQRWQEHSRNKQGNVAAAKVRSSAPSPDACA